MNKETLIDDLANVFIKHGKVLSRREYQRLEDKPCSHKQYEKHFGWGEAQKLATIRMIHGNREQEEPPLEKKDKAESRQRATIMAGLKKRALPPKYREMIGDLISCIEETLEDTNQPIIIPHSSGKEAACLLISDIHAGKLVLNDQGEHTYDKNICAGRLRILTERTIKLLTRHLNPINIDEVWIILAGDLVDGSGIYPGQELNQDLTNFKDQLALVVASLWNLIQQIRQRGWIVKVRGVRGNHGRQHQFAPADNNFDYLVMQMLKMLTMYEDPGVDVKYSPVEYFNFRIKGHNIHLRHEGPAQAETAAARARLGGFSAIHKYDIFCYAHLHHPNNSSYLDKVIFMNGCIPGIDDLAERMATFSRPSQTLFGIDPDIGVSFYYNVYLDVNDIGPREYETLEESSPILKTIN